MVRVSIVDFIVGNTVELVNVTMNMTMNPTNSNKASENSKKKKVLARRVGTGEARASPEIRAFTIEKF